MLKHIRIAMLSCAVALSPSPAAFAAYEQICLQMGATGHGARLILELVDRNTKESTGTIRHDWNNNAFTTTCYDPPSPGVGVIAKVEAYWGNTTTCSAHDDNKNTHPGFWLMADGPESGRLTFRDDGTVRNHKCRQTQSELQMHSLCASTYDGMDNLGCEHFWPSRDDVGGDYLHRVVRDETGQGWLGVAVKQGADVDGVAPDGAGFGVQNTALHIAAYLNRRVYARALTGNAEANLDVRNGDGHTPLSLSVYQGNRGIMEDLLDRGADPNLGANNGDTPVYLAAKRVRDDYMRMLIEDGADVDRKADNGETPLTLASRDGNPNTAWMLLRHGADPNLTADSGDFPLYVAARENNANTLRTLVENGAEVDAAHANGKTALEIARENDSRDALNYLRSIGASEDVYDAMIYDIVEGRRGARLLREAVRNGADINFPGPDGKTALHLAAEGSLRDYVLVLTRESALNVEATDSAGRTALLAAVAGNPSDTWVLRALLSKRANPNATDADGDFPIYVAVENGRRDILRLLASGRGVDLNQCHSQDDMTARQRAEQLAEEDRETYWDVFQFLVRRGAASSVSGCGASSSGGGDGS